MNRHTLPTAEVFGPTWQGEGPYCGRLAWFIRLGGCNLSCSWCDTPYTWDESRYDLDTQCPPTPVGDITEGLPEHPQGHITVVTGGEPLLHQRKPAFTRLLQSLAAASSVHVETNGTIPPTPTVADAVAHFTVSPKLGNAGDPHHRRIKPAALRAFSHLAQQDRACFKFVATTPADLTEIGHLTTTHHLPPNAVWVMPQGTTGQEVIDTHRQIAEAILAQGWNTTTRLHTLLWGGERQR